MKFDIGTNGDGKQYVFQAVIEHDKNHGIDETDVANPARMYENPGNYKSLRFSHKQTKKIKNILVSLKMKRIKMAMNSMNAHLNDF